MTNPARRASDPIMVDAQHHHPQIGRVRALANRIAAAVRWFFGLIFPCCCANPAPRADSPAPPPSPALAGRADTPPASLGRTPATMARRPDTPTAEEAAPTIPQILIDIRTSGCLSFPLLVDSTLVVNLPSTTVIITRNPNNYRRAGSPLVQAQREHLRLVTDYNKTLAEIARRATSPAELLTALAPVRDSITIAATSLASQATDAEQNTWPKLSIPEQLTDLERTAMLWNQLDAISRARQGSAIEKAGLLFHAAELADQIHTIPDRIREQVIMTYERSATILDDWKVITPENHPDYGVFVAELHRNHQRIALKLGCVGIIPTAS